MGNLIDKTAALTPLSCRVICDKATEYPHSGIYNTLVTHGTYLCRRCGLALFRGNSQFSAGCGWPSFDDEIEQAIKKIPDSDGLRIEICCHRCDAHLGHTFTGEHLTQKNRRHCVNSVAIDFVEDDTVIDTEEALVAGGCFWGVDYYLRCIPGVLKVEAGYSGGTIANPTYNDVCSGNSGHYEAVRVVFDVAKTSYTAILKRFFEIHDPTQHNGQGPDLGHQYQSAVFCYNQEQRIQTEKLIYALKQNGYDVATHILPTQPFWPAEDYHQNYYGKSSKTPYCHQPVTRFSS